MFERIEAGDSSEALSEAAKESEARLHEALSLASARASRSSEKIKRLFASATVSGKVPGPAIKAGAVTFSAEPFRGGLHLMYPWKMVSELSKSELASSISSNLRMSLRDRERS